MGNQLSENGNYRHSHGNLFPQVYATVSLLSYQYRASCHLPDANAFCAEFADYLNLIINNQDFCY